MRFSAVLDLDSHAPAAFSEREAAWLEGLGDEVFARRNDVVW